MALLEVTNLSVTFPTLNGEVRSVDGLSFSLERGETLGVVGESGSGKSVTASAILGLIESPGRIVSGDIVFDGQSLPGLSEDALLQIRGKRIAMIFQEPSTSLNPTLSVGEQMVEAIDHERYDRWRSGLLSGLGEWLAGKVGARRNRRQTIEKTAARLLESVRIPDAEGLLQRHPYTLSGGMMQRVMISIAIASEPDLLIADEPTTALDVTIQAQILDILRERRDASGLTVMLITHDLGLVAELCDKVIVMYAGQCVEQAPIEAIFDTPRHPYTRGLLASIPSMDDPADVLPAIEGSVPDIGKLPREACHFAWNGRCPLQTEICRSERPQVTEVGPDHRVGCHVYSHPGMTHLRNRLDAEVWPPSRYAEDFA
jgi:oligopeptide/dipeptide ABC transporter ATP-binding protein